MRTVAHKGSSAPGSVSLSWRKLTSWVPLDNAIGNPVLLLLAVLVREKYFSFFWCLGHCNFCLSLSSTVTHCMLYITPLSSAEIERSPHNVTP